MIEDLYEKWVDSLESFDKFFDDKEFGLSAFKQGIYLGKLEQSKSIIEYLFSLNIIDDKVKKRLENKWIKEKRNGTAIK